MLDNIFDSLITLETCEMNDRWSERARFQRVQTRLEPPPEVQEERHTHSRQK